jgi:hypothetical protein
VAAVVSPTPRPRPTAARAVLVASCLYGFVASSWLWGGRGEVRQGYEVATLDVGSALDLASLTAPIPRLGMACVLVAGLAGFLFRRRELASGAFAFAVLTVSAVLELTVRGVRIPGLELLLPGNLLAAWLVGLAVARWRGAPDPDDEAHEVVCGVLGATLVLAAGCKLWYGGLDWVGGRPLALIVYERSFGAAPGIADVRLAFAERPWLGALGASFTLVTEAAGGLFVVPRLRRTVAALLVPLFVGLFVLMGILHLVWVALPLALAWSHLGVPRNTEAPAT